MSGTSIGGGGGGRGTPDEHLHGLGQEQWEQWNPGTQEYRNTEIQEPRACQDDAPAPCHPVGALSGGVARKGKCRWPRAEWCGCQCVHLQSWAMFQDEEEGRAWPTLGKFGPGGQWRGVHAVASCQMISEHRGNLPHTHTQKYSSIAFTVYALVWCRYLIGIMPADEKCIKTCTPREDDRVCRVCLECSYPSCHGLSRAPFDPSARRRYLRNLMPSLTSTHINK